MKKLLLICGILSSLVYVAANFAGAIVWDGYRSFSQTISELVAVDAPSQRVVAPLFAIYDLLLIAFAFAVWRAAGQRRSLHIAAGLLFAVAVIGLFLWPLAPMHLRGAEKTLSDTMHIVITMVVVPLILLALGFGAAALGRPFRLYSILTLALVLASGAAMAFFAPRIDANLPTPWAGVLERINLGGYLLWVVVLAVALLREEGLPRRPI